MRQLLIDDEGGVGTGGGTCGGNPTILTPKWLDINWTHTEPNYAAQKGFRLVIYLGSDPNDTSQYLLAPIELGPDDRRFVQKVTPAQSLTAKAAIQTTYHNGNESSWRVLGGGVVVDPDTVVVGTQAGVDAATNSANTANTAIGLINDPDTISKDEKPQIIQDYATFTGENADLVAKANLNGVSHSAYDAAYTALVTTYLPTLTSPTAWNSLTGVTSLGTGNRVTLWNAKWLALRSATNDLKGALASGAFQAATAAAATAATANSNANTALANAPVNVNGLPALPNATYPANKLVYDNTTKRLYRSTGSAWEASTTDAGDLTGTLNAARVAVGSLDSKITTVTNSQLGTGIDITKLTGTLDAARVAVGSLDAKISVVDAAKLTTGTLDVARIATNALDQSKIASLPTSKLTGTVGADLIAANSIVAGNMVLANFDNLIPNPNSEQTAPAGGWPSGAWEAAGLTAGNAYTGSNCRSTTGLTYLTGKIPVTEGEMYLLQSFAKFTPSGNGAILYAMGYDASGAQTGNLGGFMCTAGSAYAACGGSFAIPSGTVFIAVFIYAFLAGTAYFDNLYLRRMADANLIVDGAITTQKMTANSISGDRITAGTLDASKIVADSITSSQIAANAITSNELAANAVTAGKILAGTIVAADIAASTITGAKIAGTTITAANLAADTITANEIAANAITSNELAANAVTAGKILAGTIVAADIAASTITGAKIAATTITAANIAADTITAGQIAAGAIGASEIAARSIVAANMVITNFDNLIPNPNSEQAAPSGGWPAGSYEIVGLQIGGGVAASGNNCRALNQGQQLWISPQIPVTPGDWYLLQARIKTPASGNAYIYVYGYDASMTPVGNVWSASPPSLNVYGLASSGFQVPAGVSFIDVFLYNPSAGTAYFDDLLLRRMSDANLIVDGAITANKLETDLALVNTIRSNNYVAGTSSAVATGFKVNGTGFTVTYRTGTAGSAQAEFGRDVSAAGFSFADTALRAMNNIDFTNLNGSLATAGTRYFWKGNNNPTVNLGVPDITRFTVYAGNDFTGVWANMGGSGISKLRFQVYLAPSSRDNNLDGMLSITANIYDRTTTALKLLDGKTQAFNGRVYARPDSDSNASNTGYMHTLEFIVPGTFWADIANVPNANGSWANVVVKLECCNAYGMSAARWWGFQRSGVGGPVVPVDLGGATPPSGYTLAASNVTVISPAVGSATGGSNPSWTGQYL